MIEALSGAYGIILVGLVLANLIAIGAVYYFKAKPRPRSWKTWKKSRLSAEGKSSLYPMITLGCAEVIGIVVASYVALESQRKEDARDRASREAAQEIQCDVKDNIDRLAFLVDRVDTLRAQVQRESAKDENRFHESITSLSGLSSDLDKTLRQAEYLSRSAQTKELNSMPQPGRRC